MSLNPEKISELKQLIHDQLSQVDLRTQIRDILDQSASDGEFEIRSDLTENQLLEELRRKGVIEDILKQLKFSGGQHVKPSTHFLDRQDVSSKVSALKKANVDPTRRYLYLQFTSGRAFLEHIQEPDPIPGRTSSFFTIHVDFRGQRFKSRPVPCAVEPDFQESFLLELHRTASGEASRMADVTTMLSLCDPIHIVIVRTDPSGDTALVSSLFLEWRKILSSQSAKSTMSVEMLGIGPESKVPVGVLDLSIEVIPKPGQILKEDIIAAQVAMERNRMTEKERVFLVYAKQWWKEYLQIRTNHCNRLVKIFAQDETATNRPVCAFVRPLRAGRLLDSPRQAARFVSVLGFEKTPAVGGGANRAEMWCSTHSFLARNKGDCENHATLLCSLLLGFGLRAYVCIGTKTKAVPHAWVMTVSTDGSVLFWESLTSERYIHHQLDPTDPPIAMLEKPKPTHPYQTVGCVFNHEHFYANCQPSDVVAMCNFDLSNDSRWKPMSGDAIQSVCAVNNMPHWPNNPTLCPASIDDGVASNELEHELRYLIAEHRRDEGLTTAFDDNLSYLLSPALASYELERNTGISAGNEEFQQAIRQAIPDGETFKGFPIQFIHRNARKAFAACMRSEACQAIVSCRGDHVKLAVRARVFAYPESATAVWIMFAVKYRCVL